MTKPILIILLSAVLVPCGAVAQTLFSEEPLEARRASLKAAALKADAEPDTVLPLVAAGLQDPEGSLRMLAASVLGQVQAVASTRRASKAQQQVLPPDATLGVISQCLDDEIRAVRGNCMSALVFFWRGSANSLTTRLMQRYQIEGDSLMRTQLLSHLRQIDIADPALRKIFVEALDDPAFSVQYQAALAVAATVPPEGLDRVVFQLANGDERARDAFVAALVAYGPSAARHVPLLQRLRNIESRETVRAQIDRAIRQLTGQ